MKCAGPVACSSKATWWILTTDRDAGLYHKMPRCEIHALEQVAAFLQRRTPEEVRVLPIPAWN